MDTDHLSIRNVTSLDYLAGLRSEPRGIPDDQIRQLSNFDTANEMAETLGDGRVDGVLAHVSLHSGIIRARILVLGQEPALDLILVRGVPRPQDDFATTTQGLGVGAHHANGAQVVQHVFGGNRLGADT